MVIHRPMASYLPDCSGLIELCTATNFTANPYSLIILPKDMMHGGIMTGFETGHFMKQEFVIE